MFSTGLFRFHHSLLIPNQPTHPANQATGSTFIDHQLFSDLLFYMETEQGKGFKELTFIFA